MPQLIGGPLCGAESDRRAATLVIKLPVSEREWRYAIYSRLDTGTGEWKYDRSVIDFKPGKGANFTVLVGDYKPYATIEDEKGNRTTKTYWFAEDL